MVIGDNRAFLLLVSLRVTTIEGISRTYFELARLQSSDHVLVKDRILLPQILAMFDSIMTLTFSFTGHEESLSYLHTRQKTMPL